MKKLALLALLGIMTVVSSSVIASGIDSVDDVVDPVALMDDDGTEYGFVPQAMELDEEVYANYPYPMDTTE